MKRRLHYIYLYTRVCVWWQCSDTSMYCGVDVKVFVQSEWFAREIYIIALFDRHNVGSVEWLKVRV